MRPDELTISLSCPPELRGSLPAPELTADRPPKWLDRMPAVQRSERLGGREVPTARQCPPFVDALRCGILFPLGADLVVRGGEFEWDREVAAVAGAPVTIAPLGVHVPEQVEGMPLDTEPARFIVKFTNCWTVGLPAGWSMLFTHPLNRLDLPFRTLSGIVDCDTYSGDFVHFPALWHDHGFEGVLPRGTPVAQGIPIRRVSATLDLRTIEDGDLVRRRAAPPALGESPGG